MAEITEQQIREAFGVGAQEQEPAAPAEAETPETAEGAQEQEPAAPVQGADQDPPDGDAGSTADTADREEPDKAADPQEDPNKPLTPEQRRENAARRRQAEQQQAVNQAVASALAEERQKNEAALQDFFAKANLKNTITGEPITNLQQFHEWNAAFEQAKLSRDLKNGKLTAEGLATAIGNHPIVKQAQALVDQDAKNKQAQAAAAAKARIDQEIAKIHEIDASINTVEDLFKAPYGQELYAMTKRGYSIKDAHYLLNRDRLEQAKADAVRQQAQANIRGKEHMTGKTTPRGGGTVSVPAADMALFRQFNPGATDAEIQAYYNKYMKR